MVRIVLVLVLVVIATAGCTRGPDPAVVIESAAPAAEPPPAPSATPAPSPSPAPIVDVPIRLVRRVDDAATAGFATFTAAVLTDPRGWRRAGFQIRFADDAPYTVVLAEGAEVDALCHPYDTGGTFSCQNGPVVALNADRWRTATTTWPGTLAEYRTMLINHEVGHLLGQHHPEQRCSRPGRPAAVMAQQSSRLRGCAANPWPLRWEIACARRHEEPLAPGYEESPRPLCGPADVR